MVNINDKNRDFRNFGLVSSPVGNSKKEIKLNKIKALKPNEFNRVYEASPIFPFVNKVILLSAREVFDVHGRTPASEKYGVFTNLRISNNSAVNIILEIGQDSTRSVFIPSGAIIELDRNALGGGFTSFALVNASTTTSAAVDTIRIECYKEGMSTNRILKRATELFVKQIGFALNTGAGGM